MPVAVKQLLGRSSGNADLLRELELLASLPNHPLLVMVLGCIEDHPDGKLRIVFELCNHGSVEDYFGNVKWDTDTRRWTPKATPRHLRTVLDVAQQCLVALNFLHLNSIVHRDVRCANLLLAAERPVSIRVADFGLSLADEAEALGKGPVGWMAPETLYAGVTATPAHDVYMWACMVFESVYGQPPFHAQGGGKEVRAYRVANPLVTPVSAVGAPHSHVLCDPVDDAVLRRLLDVLNTCWAPADDRPDVPSLLDTVTALQQAVPVPE